MQARIVSAQYGTAETEDFAQVTVRMNLMTRERERLE
jgi:hypothetical protein